MPRTPMPKTAIDKDRKLKPWEHKIRPPGQADASTPTLDATRSKLPNHGKLSALVAPAANEGHSPRSLLAR